MTLKDRPEHTAVTSFAEVAAYKSDLLTPQLAKKIVECLFKMITSLELGKLPCRGVACRPLSIALRFTIPRR